MSTLPWFRMYSDFIYDEKVEFLAFEDQRHYVFILCMKNLGLVDKEYPKEGMLDRVVAKRLGLYGEAFESAKKRLIEAELIDEHFQPLGWDKRQFLSDSSTDRVRAYRERNKAKRTGNVSVTAQETDTDTETDKEEQITPSSAQAQPDGSALPKSKPSAAKPKQSIAIPPWLSSDAWGMWDEFRRAKSGKGWTAGAKALSIRELSKLRDAGHDPQAVIEQSIQRGWTGLFEIRQGATASPSSQSAAQRRSDWTADLNATIAKHTGTHQPEMQDLGVFDASGNRI